MHTARARSDAPRPAVTVADALRLALPPATRVAEGHDHLRRAVSWIRLFVTRPYQLGALEPDALVVLSLRGLNSGTQTQRFPRLVETLASARVSAIVLTEESSSICEAARAYDTLSVLVLPRDASLQEIERAVIALILDRSSQVERRVTEVYEQLIHLALRDSPLAVLASALADASERVIYLEDEYGALQALEVPPDFGPRGLPSPEEAALLYSARDVLGISPATPAGPARSIPPLQRILADGEHAVCSAPITLGDAVVGFLTILGSIEDIQDLDEYLVVRCASAFAIPIARQRAIIETQTRLQGSFLEGLFSGNLHNEDDLLERARYLGHDLRDRYGTACLVLDDRAGPRGVRTSESQRAATWASFLDSARREISQVWPRALLKDRGATLAIVVPSESDEAATRASLERIRAGLSDAVSEAAVTCGIGPVATGPAEIVRSYLQAEQAARIGAQFLGGDQTVAFGELGAYRLLASVENQQALDGFYEEYLGAIEGYDARYNGELVETLEGFFSANGNHARAADGLHLHRNTLLYRLARIEALTGRDLGDPETRLCLQLALKIRHLGTRKSVPKLAPIIERNGS
ncbi:MAG: helix-turn-helix domain-containing protein [Chloroflexi bacterium]|nr:helix-turn-helix domain-containing protein [Chloroflexota bacterium]